MRKFKKLVIPTKKLCSILLVALTLFSSIGAPTLAADIADSVETTTVETAVMTKNHQKHFLHLLLAGKKNII